MSDVVRESVAAYGATLRRMTVREYYLAAESGVIDPDERLELLRGEVVETSPQKSLHAWATGNLAKVLQRTFPDASIRAQFPLRLDDTNEPEPDVLVALGPDSRYVGRHPGPADVLLVVEVSDTTLRKDRTLKGPLYAEFGIPEYWILDLNASRLEVYRDPGKDGEG
ncbi:MAG TPA: Uma2 family endonuclease, partial [Fimbriimonadaceae bacterium]|nr:Uma2 family endonuclease [Fimbriimonadaceae bacterium]